MDRVKEFLSTISHEIRTPLTSIRGFSKTILDSYDNLTDEQKKKFIKIIFDQSERLKNLVENALTAANTDEEHINLVYKKTDINLILNKSIELVKMNYKNMQYAANLTKGLFSALDTDKFEQILVNILDNASKYSLNSKIIDIKTYSENGNNIISVKNYGAYIPKDEQDKIFDKFYRVESYLTSNAQGSGLGLYIVKMLTEKMNGHIEVHSDNKKEAFVEFRVIFPAFVLEDFTKGTKIV